MKSVLPPRFSHGVNWRALIRRQVTAGVGVAVGIGVSVGVGVSVGTDVCVGGSGSEVGVGV